MNRQNIGKTQKKRRNAQIDWIRNEWEKLEQNPHKFKASRELTINNCNVLN